MRPTFVEINLEHLIKNFQLVRSIVGKEVSILAVVKADAYGHGAVSVSRALLDSGVDMLGVATVEEGLELREAGINLPIVHLGAIQKDELTTAVNSNILPTVYSLDTLSDCHCTANKSGRTLGYHLKIDTGMGRLGFKIDGGDLRVFLSRIKKIGNLNLEGVFTHLACADEPDGTFTVNQINNFIDVVELLRSSGIIPKYVHCSNSAAIQKFPESHFNMVRPGIMLYGSGSYRGNKLFPVMKLKSRIIQIKTHPKDTPISYGGTFVTKKQSDIATIPIGYADGYLRNLSNRAFVSINGERAPVVGTVCMDFIMVDITNVEGVSVGDEVILFGDEVVSVDDVANWADTIPYEIMSVLGKRVPRIFV